MQNTKQALDILSTKIKKYIENKSYKLNILRELEVNRFNKKQILLSHQTDVHRSPILCLNFGKIPKLSQNVPKLLSNNAELNRERNNIPFFIPFNAGLTICETYRIDSTSSQACWQTVFYRSIVLLEHSHLWKLNTWFSIFSHKMSLKASKFPCFPEFN